MKLRQIGFALVVPSLVVALWAATVLIPNTSAQRDLDQRLAATEQQVVALAGTLEQSMALTGRAGELEEQAIRLDRAVPPAVDTVGVIRLLHDLAVEHGVAVSSVSPTTNTADPSLGSSGTSTLTISLEGNYSGTLSFIDGLLVAERLIRIDRVDLSADAATGSLFVDLTVSAYSSEGSTLTEIATPGAVESTGVATVEATLEAES